MAKKVRLAYAAAALIPLAVAAGCSSSSSSSASSGSSSAPSSSPVAETGPALPTAPASSSTSLTETGSTLLFPLMGTWSTAYTKQYPQVKMTTAGTGSGTGITDAATGTVNIGASDAYLSSAEKTQYPTLLNIPLAISSQEISFNVPGVKSLKLDGTVLADIYTGKITNWNDSAIAALNPGVSLPNLKIVPLRRLDSSGDTFIYTTYLNDQDPGTWPASDVGTTVSWPAVTGELSETGNGGMVSGCGATKGCIAYIGISYESQTEAAGLGQAKIKDGAGNFVSPTATTIAAEAAAFISKTPADETISLENGNVANGYPIVNYEYAVVSARQPSAAKAQALRAFLDWAVTSGSAAAYLGPVRFRPLPPDAVSLSEAQIAKISSTGRN